jgi:tRNA A37 threonylcarbamoyladenosine dehydratase
MGTGSLGSAVPRKLVKAGVGGFLIIDPDALSWDNIARHELGAKSVGKPKAEAIVEARRGLPAPPDHGT